jgi:hypothetical protein
VGGEGGGRSGENETVGGRGGAGAAHAKAIFTGVVVCPCVAHREDVVVTDVLDDGELAQYALEVGLVVATDPVEAVSRVARGRAAGAWRSHYALHNTRIVSAVAIAVRDVQREAKRAKAHDVV